jgi:hypothetical protein
MNENSDSAFAQVLAADDKRYAFMLAKDYEGLAGILDDAILYTHSTGVTDTKDSYLNLMRSGVVTYKSVNRQKEMFTRSGDTVMFVGEALVEAVVKGDVKQLNNRFTTTWVRRDGNWTMLSWASTPIGAH